MPKLWNETIESHRREVSDAILEAAWALAAERGLLAVTMSQIAQRTGIGRATLYKYFPDVEAILLAYHERHIAAHLRQLAELGEEPGDPAERLEAVLRAYGHIRHHREHHTTEQLGALLHRGEHIDRAQQQVHTLIRDLLKKAADTGGARDDITPDELASYCLHALGAAGGLRSKAAVDRLVTVVLQGLQPTPPPP